MNFHGSPEAEAQALRRAASRAGCDVRELAIKDTSAGRRAVGTVVCRDGWGAARMLVASSLEDAATDGARELAMAIRSQAPDDESYAHAIQAFVKERVRFAPEVGEIFQNAGVTLDLGYGDCDDHARLVYVLAIAGGLPAAQAFLHRGQGPTHAVAMLCPDGACSFAETTVDADYGEHPIDAAIRLGLVSERPDLAREVVIMTENDLPPAPAGFGASQEQTEADAEALRRLGFVVEDEIAFENVPHPALANWFRQAVARAQLAANGAAGPIDGLIGPRTRAWIASQLPLDDFGMGYVAAASPVGAPKYTAHLSSKFFRETSALAQRFRAKGANVTGEDFLVVWLGESGIRTVKQGHPPATDYYGLNMMQEKFIRASGWTGTFEEYRELPAEDQIPFIERFYTSNVKGFAGGDWSILNGPAPLYLMNFLPAFIKKGPYPDNPNVLSRRDDPKWGWIYRDNPGFDPEKKGWIERDDIGRWIERAKAQQAGLWNEAVARLRAEGGVDAPSNGGGGGVVALALGILAVGGALAYAKWG